MTRPETLDEMLTRSGGTLACPSGAFEREIPAATKAAPMTFIVPLLSFFTEAKRPNFFVTFGKIIATPTRIHSQTVQLLGIFCQFFD